MWGGFQSYTCCESVLDENINGQEWRMCTVCTHLVFSLSNLQKERK